MLLEEHWLRLFLNHSSSLYNTTGKIIHMKLGFYTQKSKNKAKESSQLKAIARRFNKDIGGFNETEEWVGEDGSCIPVPFDVDPEEVIQADPEDQKTAKMRYTPVMPMSFGQMGYTLSGGGYPVGGSGGYASNTKTSHGSTSPYTSSYSSGAYATSGQITSRQFVAQGQIRTLSLNNEKDPNSVEYDICIVADGDTRQDNPQIHAGYCNVEIIRA